jgi:hypothetical protein
MAKLPLTLSIQELTLTGSTGDLNLKEQMIQFVYYEDLFAFCFSGVLTVTDSAGNIENLQLTGNDSLKIVLGQSADDPNKTTEIFRVYKITKRKPSGNLNSETYDLCLCSEDLMISEQIKVSKSYPGMKISDIITDILQNQLGVSKPVTAEATTGIYDFIVPTFKPFEAISWLSTYARSAKYSGSDMILFETKEGYFYRSLQSIYSDEVYNIYKYDTKNLPDSKETFSEKELSIQRYEIFKNYDMLNEENSGTFANRLISIDPLIRSFYVTDFDYKKYSGVMLNGNPPTNFYVNRQGNAINTTYEGVLKMATTNKNEKKSSYITTKQDRVGSVAQDIFIETYVPLRTAQISLSNYSKMKIEVPGDTELTVGKVIQVKINSINQTGDTGGNNRDIDKYYSGVYLVTALQHVFRTNQFVTLLEIARDSSMTGYDAPPKAIK